MSRRGFGRYLPEFLLTLSIALPWFILGVFGLIWLWQTSNTFLWVLATTALSLLGWPLSVLVHNRADREARAALGDAAEPSSDWSTGEITAWDDVKRFTDTITPFSFATTAPIVTAIGDAIEIVARHFHSDSSHAWAQFTLPEALLLAERLCHDLRREALRHIPGVRAMTFRHFLWLRRQNARYGGAASTGWTVGFAAWRVMRAVLNPFQAAAQETGNAVMEQAVRVLSYRLRAYATRLILLEVGRAAIDLYSGRLSLSGEDIRVGPHHDEALASLPGGPIRIMVVGQRKAGKSTLVNSLADNTRSAVALFPEGTEHFVDRTPQPSVILTDGPNLGDQTIPTTNLTQWERSDLILWVVSAVNPLPEIDRAGIQQFRSSMLNPGRSRKPEIIIVLSHVDELQSARVLTAGSGSSSCSEIDSITAAVATTSQFLDMPQASIVPVMPAPESKLYIVDALWKRIGTEFAAARRVQLDRFQQKRRRMNLSEVGTQLSNALRRVFNGVFSSSF